MNLFMNTDCINKKGVLGMSNELSIEELFAELKQELDFLPEDDAVREGFLQVLRFLMIM